MNYVFSTRNPQRYRFPTHINDLVVDRSESQASEVFLVVLDPGEAPPLHRHPDTEQVFHVLEGEGELSIGTDGEKYPMEPGDVVRIPMGTLHSARALGPGPLRYLTIDCFPQGRPTAEPTWDAHVRVLCREQGWDYDEVIRRSAEKPS